MPYILVSQQNLYFSIENDGDSTMDYVINLSRQRSRVLRFSCLAFLIGISPVILAQHTAVNNNGSGRIEMDYNAAEKVTEIRTIGADGKLQQKVDYEYLPGYYSAQKTDTTYWPNSSVRRVARNTYDESSNFTGEFVQAFDESGKQVSGHKLTHDPWTNIYRCSEWDVASQDYKTVNCPSGEEGGGEEHESRKFTYEEVTRHLDTARKAVGSAAHGDRSATAELGLVLPAIVFADDRISGTVVDNPGQYEYTPEIIVTRLKLPVATNGGGSQLRDWMFEAPGQDPQRADGPITFVVPRNQSRLIVTFRRAEHRDVSVSTTLEFSQEAQRSKPPQSFESAALCLKDQLCEVEGPFSGDTRNIFAAWDDRPALILAATPRSAFIGIPDLTEPGARALIIAEGSKLVALPIAVGNFFIKNNGRELQAGQTLIVSPTLDGPGDIEESSWSADKYSSTSLREAQRFIPNFQPASEREDQESDGKADADENGEILIIVTNRASERSSLRSSKNGMLVFQLSKESFSRGEFKYDLVVEAKAAGKVEVEGHVISFLAPVDGQEFTLKADAH